MFHYRHDRDRRRSVATVVGGALLLASLASASRAQFVEVAASAGIQFDQVPEPVVPYGGGSIWADFNGDGAIDLFATQSVGCNRLFINRGDGTFGPKPFAAGAAACGDLGRGGTAADYDNDGDQDLYLTNHGQNRMYENKLTDWGILWFEEITEAAGMHDDGAQNSASAVWGDYDNDGDLDLFVTNHSLSISLLNCEADLLWRNEGDGTFRELGMELGVADSGELERFGCGLAATWSDYDNDGDPDLMVVNDFGHTRAPNRLFRNDGPGPPPGGWRLTDVSAETGFDYEMYGMGIAIADLNRDGRFDYYMSDIGPNNLALSGDGGVFVESAAAAEVEASDIEIYGGEGLVSWGTVFADLDLDGREDLVVANGGADEILFPGMFGFDYINDNPNYVYWNRGREPFVELHRSISIDDEGHHRNVTFVDYDLDGDLDLHFGVLQGPNRLYRNDTELGNHWLAVEVRGSIGNRDGIGARLRLTDAEGKTQMREVDGGSTMLSLSDRTVYFGLGPSSSVPLLEVLFPSGAALELVDLAADQRIEVVEPEALIEIDPPGSLSPGRSAILQMRLTNLSADPMETLLELTLVPPDGLERPAERAVSPLGETMSIRLEPGTERKVTPKISLPQGLRSGRYTLHARLSRPGADWAHDARATFFVH